jgi:hypothetical protein
MPFQDQRFALAREQVSDFQIAGFAADGDAPYVPHLNRRNSIRSIFGCQRKCLYEIALRLRHNSLRYNGLYGSPAKAVLSVFGLVGARGLGDRSI